MTRDPIWITGVGAFSTLGSNYAQIAEALLSGVSGVRRITQFPVADHPAQIAGMLDDIPCPTGWSAADFTVLSRVDQLALWCCTGALQDGGWWPRRSETRIGLVLGNAAEWTTPWETDFLQGGTQIFQPQNQLEPLTQRTCRRLGVSGPAASMSAACASGNYALALARRWLQMGDRKSVV
jgi:3-oxoacyl-[acyl-carrier-protein] synthase II